jgi:hypothetical protein
LCAVHPRLKQEVGRRLALVALGVQFLQPVMYEGPTLLGVQLSNDDGTAAVLAFAPASAHNLHLSGSAGCHDCCATPHSQPYYSPFEVQAPNGTWLPALKATVHRTSVLLISAVPISGVRGGWGGMPDCLLYNGVGGAHNHSALAAPPFRSCLYGNNGLPAWNWLSDCLTKPATDVLPSADGAIVASAALGDWFLGTTAIVRVAPDESTSGVALQTGAPKQGASWLAKSVLACAGAAWVVDSVEISLRYRAAPNNASAPTSTAATLTVALVNEDTKPVATLAAAVPLGNYSAAAGFSAPMRLRATGLNAPCDGGLGTNAHGRLLLQMAVTNNDRPVTIPIDDLAGGFRIKVGWVKASA